MNTSPKNDYNRRSNTIDYILIAIGCGLVLYGAIDFHFFSKRMRAEIEATDRILIELLEHNREDLEEINAELESLNAETQRVNAEEK